MKKRVLAACMAVITLMAILPGCGKKKSQKEEIATTEATAVETSSQTEIQSEESVVETTETAAEPEKETVEQSVAETEKVGEQEETQKDDPVESVPLEELDPGEGGLPIL